MGVGQLEALRYRNTLDRAPTSLGIELKLASFVVNLEAGPIATKS